MAEITKERICVILRILIENCSGEVNNKTTPKNIILLNALRKIGATEEEISAIPVEYFEDMKESALKSLREKS